MAAHNEPPADPNEWNNSLWACCNPFDLCFLANCFPCFPWSKSQHMLTENGDTKEYSGCNSDCCLFYLVGCIGCQGLMIFKQRRDIERKFNMQDHNGCVDCLAACFCQPCSIVQQQKEIEDRFENARLINEPKPQQNMAYMPQTQQPMGYPQQQSPPQQYIQQSPPQQYITQGQPEQQNVQYGMRTKTDYTKQAI